MPETASGTPWSTRAYRRRSQHSGDSPSITSARSLGSSWLHFWLTGFNVLSFYDEGTVKRPYFDTLFWKIVVFSKICLGSPPSKFLEVCIISEYMWLWSPVYNFNSARALKKLLSASVEVTHFAKLRHIEGFTCVKAFIQICLTSTLFCLINKTGTYHIKAFESPFNFFWVVDNNFSPWENIVRKKVSKLRSIAELRAFDGIFVGCLSM